MPSSVLALTQVIKGLREIVTTNICPKTQNILIPHQIAPRPIQRIHDMEMTDSTFESTLSQVVKENEPGSVNKDKMPARLDL